MYGLIHGRTRMSLPLWYRNFLAIEAVLTRACVFHYQTADRRRNNHGMGMYLWPHGAYAADGERYTVDSNFAPDEGL